MTWLAVHPSNTETVTLPADTPGAPTFVIGYWPPRIAERIHAEMARLRKHDKDDQDLTVTPAQFLATVESRYELTRLMVIYGVRGWEGLTPTAETIELDLDGRKHPCLTQDGLVLLHANKLVGELALACLRFNVLTAAEKKTLSSPSVSAGFPSGTSAASASPGGRAHQAVASSASTIASSRSAPTG